MVVDHLIDDHGRMHHVDLIFYRTWGQIKEISWRYEGPPIIIIKFNAPRFKVSTIAWR